ncbi:hypothetical protein [Chitinophaga pinensis]|nr:hypothetical protein [Chitinophaga pinensis]
MIQTTGLHSTFDKRIACKGSRIVREKTYNYFYNPMWSFYGEYGKGDVNGTYYKPVNKPVDFGWNMFDQVLVRPSLLANVFDESSLKIITQIGSVNLLNNNNVIKKGLSDHLPIEFNLNNI